VPHVESAPTHRPQPGEPRYPRPPPWSRFASRRLRPLGRGILRLKSGGRFGRVLPGTTAIRRASDPTVPLTRPTPVLLHLNGSPSGGPLTLGSPCQVLALVQLKFVRDSGVRRARPPSTHVRPGMAKFVARLEAAGLVGRRPSGDHASGATPDGPGTQGPSRSVKSNATRGCRRAAGTRSGRARANRPLSEPLTHHLAGDET